MPISQIDKLFRLVKSLDKSEKRHFRLFVNRLESNDGVLFIRLFDFIDKSQFLDEEKLKDKLSFKSSTQYSNTKRNLYTQILKSLRQVYVNKEKKMAIREQIDYASILYDKSLFDECRSILERVKPSISQINDHTLSLEILDIQKRIQSRYLSNFNKNEKTTEALIKSSINAERNVMATTSLLNFALLMRNLQSKIGYAKNVRDLELLHAFYYSNLAHLNPKHSEFYSTIYWHQAHLLYNQMQLNLTKTFKHTLAWIKTFDLNERMKRLDFDLYLLGLNKLLELLFILDQKKRYQFWYRQLKNSIKSFPIKSNTTTSQNSFIIRNTAVLNLAIINNKFSGIDNIINEISSAFNSSYFPISMESRTLFHYKFGLVYSYKGDYETALDYFNKIIVLAPDQRTADMYCYARLNSIICHFRLGNFEFVDNMLMSIRQSFNNNLLLNKPVDILLSFFRKGCKAMNFGLNDDYIEILEKLKKHRNQQFEKVAFLYYNFIWLFESFIENDSIEKIRNNKKKLS